MNNVKDNTGAQQWAPVFIKKLPENDLPGEAQTIGHRRRIFLARSIASCSLRRLIAEPSSFFI
jgi:hypothetical protein